MPMKPSINFTGLELVRGKLLGAVLVLEGGQIRVVLGESDTAAALLLLFLAAHGDVPFQLGEAAVHADVVVFRLAEFHAADGGEILRVVGSLDQVLGRNAFGQRSAALFPDLGNVGLPAIAHALDVAVGAAQQQDHGQQGIAARQHAEVLHHDGLEQRRHQFVGRNAHLLQTVDIGLGEHAALTRYRMQFDALVTHLA